ncbi:S-adenosyl-L-methionine-dependent methyltransferase [Jaminaea rosea]|uniref:S-adenosyl-L-methionine-dependent methyltransferase n=1 Tax=Jaminaea rosea TaxID=1569628 RepID=A0A316URY5_9BASI|nr:S-adenosyl-L-methionine-dependent methyltransferase [Jaminaea rosea]PWN27744.1 S-adenosyl-L-methionine-dependent methyltransferase [Jaminaea rosea]
MSSTAATSASPPPKRQRVESPRASTAPTAAASSFSVASTSAQPQNGINGANGASANQPNSRPQRPLDPKHFAKKVKAKEKARQATLCKTGEEPIWFDILAVLGREKVDEIMSNNGQGSGEWQDKFQRDTIFESRVLRLSAKGEGVMVAPSGDWVLTVPHVLPGELVRVRVDRNERLHSKCDLVEVLEKSDDRRDDLVGCKYFGDCAGCQYQMLTYEKQLSIKQDVVTHAFAHYSGLDPSLLPSTLPTLPSPMQYGYRTKLTPHFEIPRSLTDFRRKNTHGGGKGNFRRGKGKGQAREQMKGVLDKVDPEELEELSRQWADDVSIGFDTIKGGGKSGILDIEECPLATPALQEALPVEKRKVKNSINSFPNGATLLLRDSLTASAFGISEDDRAKDPVSTRDGGPTPALVGDSEVVTSYRAVVREKVQDVRFETPSGSFFQNNRSVLPGLIEYVREAILSARSTTGEGQDQEHYLVDTYCGSGLFALLLAPLFKEVAGVEITAESIDFARRNATLNSIPNVRFLAGNAEDIFGTISYPPARTTVVIDPPRRGCDEAFVKQLVNLGPEQIVYVSCNVHTQARDVGQIVRGSEGGYEVVSVRGADLFPQTYHVEGVCVLRRKRSNEGEEVKKEEEAKLTTI